MHSSISSFYRSCFTILILSSCLWGCTSAPKEIKQPPIPRLPATEMGVRTTRTGEAVAEVDLPLNTAFDLAETHLRKTLKVTFVNRSNGKIEAENKKAIFILGFTSLLTGKTGISVTALDHDEKIINPYTARDVADTLVKELQVRPEKIPMKIGGVEPREF